MNIKIEDIVEAMQALGTPGEVIIAQKWLTAGSRYRKILERNTPSIFKRYQTRLSQFELPEMPTSIIVQVMLHSIDTKAAQVGLEWCELPDPDRAEFEKLHSKYFTAYREWAESAWYRYWNNSHTDVSYHL